MAAFHTVYLTVSLVMLRKRPRKNNSKVHLTLEVTCWHGPDAAGPSVQKKEQRFNNIALYAAFMDFMENCTFQTSLFLNITYRTFKWENETCHPRPTEFRIFGRDLRIYGDLWTSIGCFWESLVQVTERQSVQNISFNITAYHLWYK